MLSVKSRDNIGAVWKDGRGWAYELEGKAARSSSAKAIVFHNAKVSCTEKDGDILLIHHPSYPEYLAINDFIDPNPCSVQHVNLFSCPHVMANQICKLQTLI